MCKIISFSVFFLSLSFTLLAEQAPKKLSKKEKQLIELQKQQEILDRYKPLIEPRSYSDLIEIIENRPLLKLNRLPKLDEAIVPGRSPNVKLIPYLLKSFAHPAYQASFKGVRYFIAVNCEGPGAFDDCSTTPSNQFKGRKVFVRFLQSNDPRFNSVTGMKIGDSFGSVAHLFSQHAEVHGDGECVETKQRWLACFDGNNLSVNKKRLQMMPGHDAKLTRFLKIRGKAY